MNPRLIHQPPYFLATIFINRGFILQQVQDERMGQPFQDERMGRPFQEERMGRPFQEERTGRPFREERAAAAPNPLILNLLKDGPAAAKENRPETGG